MHEMNVQMSLTGYRKDYGEVGAASWSSEEGFIRYLRMMGASGWEIQNYREHGWVEFVVEETRLICGVTRVIRQTKYHYFKPYLPLQSVDIPLTSAA